MAAGRSAGSRSASDVRTASSPPRSSTRCGRCTRGLSWPSGVRSCSRRPRLQLGDSRQLGVATRRADLDRRAGPQPAGRSARTNASQRGGAAPTPRPSGLRRTPGGVRSRRRRYRARCRRSKSFGTAIINGLLFHESTLNEAWKLPELAPPVREAQARKRHGVVGFDVGLLRWRASPPTRRRPCTVASRVARPSGCISCSEVDVVGTAIGRTAKTRVRVLQGL